MFLAMGLVLLIFILPALAISWVIPADELSLTAGVMQAFDAFFAYFDLQKLVPDRRDRAGVRVGGRHADLARRPVEGPAADRAARGLPAAVLPAVRTRTSVAVNILVVQGAVTTVIALLYALVPSVSSAYWILSVMTTQVYLIVYLLMFVAAVNLRTRQPNVERGYRAPAIKFLCVVGFLASAAAILIGFVPPSQFENGSDAAYVGLILAGTVLLGLLPPWLFLKFRKPELEEGRRGGDVMSGPAPTPPEPAAGNDNSWIYWIIGAVVIVLAIIGLITYSGKKDDQRGPAEGRSSSARSSRRRDCPCPTRTSSPGRWAPTAETSATTPPPRWARRSSTTRSPTAPTSSAAGRSSSTGASCWARR